MNLRRKLTAIALIVICVFTVTVPLVSVATATDTEEETASPPETTELPETTEAEETDTVTTEPDVTEPERTAAELRVYIAKEDKTVTMPLEEYIVCVVAAEMPYTFHTEALKAQAVAARSYCLNKLGSGSHKDGADVCTDYSHCQSYVSEEELISRYGKTTTNSIMTKIRNAVKETAGQIITWEGKAALAVFHSSSYKKTESSENVWGGKVPYLTSVSTPESDRVSTVTLTDSDIASLFASDSAVKVNSGGKKGIYITETDSGRAEYICLSGVAVNAKLLRQKYGFRSLDFEFEEIEGGWRFTVHGYGHGVGMSQYGANEMAKSGKTYDEILLHYYTGVSIETI
ncbi:MAG: stage II sporulation protein D [Clostridia bacterium]|nr:stage II sporulation protein D [Clostridia bacterium]